MVTGTLDELPWWAGELLETARVAHLGLLDADGYPRVLPVTFALVRGAAWTVVDDKPKERPGAELARVRLVGTVDVDVNASGRRRLARWTSCVTADKRWIRARRPIFPGPLSTASTLSGPRLEPSPSTHQTKARGFIANQLI